MLVQLLDRTKKSISADSKNPLVRFLSPEGTVEDAIRLYSGTDFEGPTGAVLRRPFALAANRLNDGRVITLLAESISGTTRSGEDGFRSAVLINLASDKNSPLKTRALAALLRGGTVSKPTAKIILKARGDDLAGPQREELERLMK